MKPVVIQLSVCLIFALLFYACKGTSNASVDELFAAWDSSKKPGVAIAVVKDGSIIYKKGYGSANLEYEIPVTSSTVFHIASVSETVYRFFNFVAGKRGQAFIG